MSKLQTFIREMPKAELHLHLEGTLEPELMFELARRNGVPLRFKTVQEVRNAYRFNNLQDFLDIYYEGAAVLLKEQDFFDLTYAYLQKVHHQQVVHVEVFFDPQTHTERGVSFDTVIGGILRALRKGQEELGITFKLILCFLRHLSQESAFQTLQQALPYREHITAVGLDSAERGNPPSKFSEVFEAARKQGFLLVAHAGEEGPAEYIWEALRLLNVNRIDHGNNALHDEALVSEIIARNLTLTVCPLSNVYLKVVPDIQNHPIRKMLDSGMRITINSDDPAYFGGYLNQNYEALAEAHQLSKTELLQLAANSFEGSFLDAATKSRYLQMLQAYGANA